MTPPSHAAWTGSAGRVLIGHALHCGVLLLPTFALAGLAGIDWPIGVFAIGLTAAGVLESLLLAAEATCQPAATRQQAATCQQAAIRDRTAMRISLLVGVCLLGLFWLAQVERHVYGPASLGGQVGGGLCLVGGSVLRVAAIRALGPRFISDIRVRGVMVREGIYAWLRHPAEVGMLLIAIGAPLLIGSPLTALAAATLLAPTSLWRMRREDLAWAARGS